MPNGIEALRRERLRIGFAWRAVLGGKPMKDERATAAWEEIWLESVILTLAINYP